MFIFYRRVGLTLKQKHISPSQVNSQFLCQFEIINIEFKEALQRLKGNSEFDNMNKAF